MDFFFLRENTIILLIKRRLDMDYKKKVWRKILNLHW